MGQSPYMLKVTSFARFSPSVRAFLFFLAAISFVAPTELASGQQNSTPDASHPPAAATPKKTSPFIVLGFVGGWVRHDDIVHSEVQLGASLQKAYGSSADVEVFENDNGKKALKRVLTLLDTNRDGTLTAAEKRDARIILYGHSWGASEAITVARELGKDGIPVLLTIQVDSVTKRHENDTVIPANVAQAANFYQPNGFVHGQNEIRAADPAHTKIIGNFKFNYRTSRYACTEYPWYDRLFAKAHTQIECDPNVWKQVESLIREYLPQVPPTEEKH
jgi:hypothetical protein